ncbi:cell wall-binding repeat-containing protein [Ornithinimicrobium faecis]|uniref:cell wall-binding repeat-containing protein n=1 Tax=Ornithinimicrobium faecis TaxID=2934158 RepID=UPI0021189977|nr:cell wall-binding repeat-containing protein [Ornithinimicrobium sp. HY1745]
MRSTLAASLALVLGVTLLPGAALATTTPEPPGVEEGTEETVEATVGAPPTVDDGQQGEQLSEPVPEEHLDQKYGLTTSDPEIVAPTTVTALTSLPTPLPGAEVYPMPDSGKYSVTGGGWGHRHGMSQHGANGAGQQGLNHQEILDFYYPGTQLETRDTGQIRVGITIDNDGVTRVDHRPGLVVSNGPDATAYPLPERDQWRVQASSNNPSSCVLQARDTQGNWTAYQPKGMPTGCPVTFTSPSEKMIDLYLPGGTRRVYRGQITATHHGERGLATVNRLPMQHYLWSVVSSEVPSNFHQQALRAQAVAARTYAERGVNGTGYYDTCDTTYCQAYKGRGKRASDGSIETLEFTANKNAVNATDGQVLTFAFSWGKGLATTMYSAATGGYTIPANADHPYLVAQEDPYDDTDINPRHRWTAELTAEALETRYQIADVARVQVTQRDGYGEWGGRIVSARVEGFLADGRYAYNDTTGIGLYLARPWPYWKTGLSTDYFTFNDPGQTPPPEPGEVTRISGSDRYETAANVAKQWAPGVSVAYIVNGQDFPDALTAAARAGIYDAPVLLSQPGNLPQATRDALTRLKPGRLVIVGGKQAVSTGVEQQLKKHTTGLVERVGGVNRYATAANLASYYGSGQSRVFLASGQGFPDALAAAALAGKQHTPLLLAGRNTLDEATIAQLDRLNPGEIVVLGGDLAVTNAVAQQAAKYATSGTYRRLAGTSRYDTSLTVAQEFDTSLGSALVTSGEQFPDALVGAALAGRRGVPVVLTKPGSLVGPAQKALTHVSPKDIDVLGGTSAVSDATLQEVEKYLR